MSGFVDTILSPGDDTFAGTTDNDRVLWPGRE
jgi:hypothetical protein